MKGALRMARLPVIKTLAGYDFSFQPSLDRNRIMALARLDFINRATGSTHRRRKVGAQTNINTNLL